MSYPVATEFRFVAALCKKKSTGVLDEQGNYGIREG